MTMTKQQAQNPLILRYHRLMDAFAKSDDERDFYLDRREGFIIYADLDKTEEEIDTLNKELEKDSKRYSLVPKMTYYEIKKFMEGFVHEKVYDIDTKEKLLDIIGSKEARENFLEFIYDNLTELEKWQQYYQERSRIRIIEWLRDEDFHFVFEEDLDLPRAVLEKVKRNLFDAKVAKDISSARDLIKAKAKTYYSSEALNPRPKRGRPPKQVAKVEIEPQFTVDIYTTVPASVRNFLFIPDITSAASVTFSSKFESEEQLLASLRGSQRIKVDERLEALSQRLESLRSLSDRLSGMDSSMGVPKKKAPFQPFSRPTVKGVTESAQEEKEEKMESAISDVFPKKRGRPKKEEEATEFKPQQRKRFAVKQVTQIKKKKKK